MAGLSFAGRSLKYPTKTPQAKEKPNTDSIQSSVWLAMMHK